jgi:hypothetical protein
VVVDDHHGPGEEIVTDAAGGGGEDDGAAPSSDARTQRMDHLYGCQSLVQVAAPTQNEDPKAVVLDRPPLGPMPSRRIRREEGQCVERNRLLACAQGFGHAGQPAAEQHEHVMVIDPEAAGQFPGAVRRPVGGCLHGLIVEGRSPQGRVTSAGHAVLA